MSNPIESYPLQWPPGWRRTAYRTRARFSKERRSFSGTISIAKMEPVGVGEAVKRILAELRRMGLGDWQIVISSNVPLRNDGLPRADARQPNDPGVAIYWQKGKGRRCMAIDRYDRVADNMAAIAATLEAMRAIERHGGAEILDRAFTGFVALPAPEQWFTILGVGVQASAEEIEDAYRRLAMQHHPDRGGDSREMARINIARDEGLANSINRSVDR